MAKPVDTSPRILSPTVRAALWMIASCGLMSVLAAIARHLSLSGMHPNMIAFFRMALALMCMLPWAAQAGWQGVKTDKFGLYCFRALISTCALMTWFWAIALIPLAEMTALSFLAPIFATIGAAVFLKETVRARRWTATLIGFLGALIIIRPGLIEMSLGSWIALAGAGFIGISILNIKTLSRTESPNKVVFYMNLLITPMALVPALFIWEMPDPALWGWILAMGPVAVLGHIMMVHAYSLGDASAIVPFDFSRLPFAVLIGWMAFGEVADLWTWVGAVVIFSSTLFITRREAAQKKNDRSVATERIPGNQ
ncbi:MAG: DMT family transporter [Rhodospirillales bacterium]|nr:DMT family transporter [Rhodospirillales bacterium]